MYICTNMLIISPIALITRRSTMQAAASSISGMEQGDAEREARYAFRSCSFLLALPWKQLVCFISICLYPLQPQDKIKIGFYFVYMVFAFRGVWPWLIVNYEWCFWTCVLIGGGDQSQSSAKGEKAEPGIPKPSDTKKLIEFMESHYDEFVARVQSFDEFYHAIFELIE